MPKSDSTDLSCSTCRLWVEQTETQDEVRWGFCHHGPPQIVPDEEGPQCVQVSTELPHWCGQHQQRVQ